MKILVSLLSQIKRHDARERGGETAAETSERTYRLSYLHRVPHRRDYTCGMFTFLLVSLKKHNSDLKIFIIWFVL